MSETLLSREIVEALRRVYGIEAIRVHSGRAKVARGWAHFAAEGTPDLCLAMYRSSWLEVKTATGRLGAVQQKRHADMERAGCRVAVVRSVAAALETVGRWRSEDRELERLVEAERALRGVGLA